MQVRLVLREHVPSVHEDWAVSTASTGDSLPLSPFEGPPRPGRPVFHFRRRALPESGIALPTVRVWANEILPPRWAHEQLREVIGLPEDYTIPPLPGSKKASLADSSSSSKPSNGTDTKRKAPDSDVDMVDEQSETTKRVKGDVPVERNGVPGDDEPVQDHNLLGAQAAAAFIPFLSPQDLLPPKLPSKEELEGVLLGLRKKALVEEYFGGQ